MNFVPRPSRPTALAIQGGGAHGAFSWGALDALLEDGLRVDAISGVSSGSLLAVAVTQGLASGGPPAARAAMRELWERVGSAQGGERGSFGMLPWTLGMDIAGAMARHGANALLRLFTPAQINPLGLNPLRDVIHDLLDRARLIDPGAPRLTVSATDVETGRARHFHNAEITADVLLASCCLPFVFPAIEIDGRAYWDGAYAGNPPLAPLLRPERPGELILVRAMPRGRPGKPGSNADVFNRMNEIAFQATLDAELAALPPDTKLTDIHDDATLLDLPIDSRLIASPALIARLFEAGRKAARVTALV
jgi:NTE family protein